VNNIENTGFKVASIQKIFQKNNFYKI